jgi:CelD/BcsL family acetyltransferase involved in cellulose biosynthesis
MTEPRSTGTHSDTPTLRHSDTPLDITSESLANLAPEWAALHARVPGATPFTHPSWHEVWLRHFGEGCQPVFLSFRRGEELVGAAALDPDRDVARQLGDHNVCDYTGVLALPGHEEAVAAGLIEWLLEDLTPTLELWGVAEDSPMRAAFAAGAASFGWSYEEEPEAVCPRTALPDDFEAYVAALPKRDRHELRRKLRNLQAAGSVSFESVTARDDILARFDRFLDLMRLSRGDKDEFLTPAMEAFFRDIAGTFAKLGMARLSTLRLDGAETAMLFSFENDATVFLYNSGYDPAFAHLAVGLLSKAYAIEDAIARGKRTFDFLRGEEEYKRRLGGVPAQVYTLRMGERATGRMGDGANVG